MKVSFVVLVFAVALVRGDLNDLKKAAIKQVDGLVAKIKKLADDTSVEVDKVVDNIKIITKHEREFGDGIIAETRFEVTKTAKSGYMLATLLGSSNDVFRCVEYREREALDDSDKFYNQKFLDVGQDYESRAQQHQRNLIKSWKDDYYRAIDQYARIYQTTVGDIQKATSEAGIANLVKQFDNITNQMANIILNILPELNKTHIQVLRMFDELVGTLQKYARFRVEETYKAIQKCFPKLFKTETLF